MSKNNILKMVLAGFLMVLLQGRLGAEAGEGPSRTEHLFAILSELQQGAQDLLHEREDLRGKVPALKKQMEELQYDLKAAQDRDDKLNVAIRELSNEEKSFSPGHENLKERLKEIALKKFPLQEIVERHEQEIKEKNNKKESLKTQEVSLQGQNEGLRKDNESLRQFTKNVSQRLEDLKAILNDMDEKTTPQELSSKVTNVGVARALKDETRKSINLSQEHQSNLQKQIESWQQISLSNTQKTQEFKSQQDQSSREMRDLENRLKILDAEALQIPQETAARRDEALGRLNALKEEIDDLKAQRAESAGFVDSAREILDRKRIVAAQIPLSEEQLQENAEILMGENDALKLELERLKKTKLILSGQETKME